MKTMTGRSSSSCRAGCQMFRNRQSSLPTAVLSVVAIVSSKRLFAPGLNRRPFCTQALPNFCVSRGFFHGSGSAGGRQRSSPTGGLAKGTPFHAKVPSFLELSTPITGPKRVSRRREESSSRSCAATGESDSAVRPAIASATHSRFLYIPVTSSSKIVLAMLETTEFGRAHASPANERATEIRQIREACDRSDLLDADTGVLQVLRRDAVLHVVRDRRKAGAFVREAAPQRAHVHLQCRRHRFHARARSAQMGQRAVDLAGKAERGFDVGQHAVAGGLQHRRRERVGEIGTLREDLLRKPDLRAVPVENTRAAEVLLV